jgi:hypothetical protein
MERKRLGRYTGIRPLIQVAPECPKMIAAIVDRLLHANPLDRYQTATEVLRDLRMVQGKLGEVEFTPSVGIARKVELPYKKSSSDCYPQNLIPDFMVNHFFGNNMAQMLKLRKIALDSNV